MNALSTKWRTENFRDEQYRQERKPRNIFGHTTEEVKVLTVFTVKNFIFSDVMSRILLAL
jgi:hypothetical protein